MEEGADKKPISLVTGGAGFIGAHVAEHLLKLGHEVIVLDDLSGGFKENVPEGVEFVKGSVTNAEMVEHFFEKHKFDYVFHLAAYAAEGLSHFIRSFNYNNNLVGSMILINAAANHDVKCFVFTSSIAVYGKNQLPMKEDLIPQPEDPYGIAKLAVEQDLKAAREMWGMNYIIFRPHNVYGEKQNLADKYRNVLGIFMNQLMQDQPLTIFGDGEQTRAFTHIDDVAPIIAKSVHVPESYNQIFNIGADKEHTVKHLAEVVAKSMGKEPTFNHLEQRKEVVHAFSDHSKVKNAFNITEETPLEAGVQRMADWAKQSGPRSGSEFGNIEVEKNLPEGWRKK